MKLQMEGLAAYGAPSGAPPFFSSVDQAKITEKKLSQLMIINATTIGSTNFAIFFSPQQKYCAWQIFKTRNSSSTPFPIQPAASTYLFERESE